MASRSLLSYLLPDATSAQEDLQVLCSSVLLLIH